MISGVFFVAVLATALGGISIRALAQRRESQIMQAHPPLGAFVSIKGRKVHYEAMGQGPDLILIHGASGTTRDMALTLAQHLKDRYRVTVFDRPGMGYSDRVRDRLNRAWSNQCETLDEQAMVLHAAATELGIKAPIVVGHSLGGAVALAWASLYPNTLSGLVPISAVSNPWPGRLDWMYRLLGSRIGGAIVPPFVAAFVTETYVNKVIETIFRPQPAPNGYGHAIGAQLAIRRNMARANARQVFHLRAHITSQYLRYGEIKVPTEIIHGDADPIVPFALHAAPLSQQIDGAVLTALPGIGHMPHHVCVDEVVNAIDRVTARAGLH